jgi:hypothetical protein
MQKDGIAAVLIGGLFVAPMAMAQTPQLAYATGEPRSEYMVFLDKGNQVPDVAQVTLRKAADAAKAGKTIHLVGRGDQAEVVKQELVRDGAPASAINLTREPIKALPKPADNIADPSSRRVEIKF